MSITPLTVATTGFNGRNGISLPHRADSLVLSAAGTWGPTLLQATVVVAIRGLLAYENRDFGLIRPKSKLGD
ncbi:hypothetical protein [Natrinema sp. CBA1119]|uniref:hypothetical protein n=1 Tax=Natrinema sp. CBA1119 TaxID=1608465 RepID=UPI00114585A1|nr:hypothetical protein [Natrinema sp. CBA1119]